MSSYLVEPSRLVASRVNLQTTEVLDIGKYQFWRLYLKSFRPSFISKRDTSCNQDHCDPFPYFVQKDNIHALTESPKKVRETVHHLVSPKATNRDLYAVTELNHNKKKQI